MEVISKVETLRQALRNYGELTAHELCYHTGVPVIAVSPLLKYDIDNGAIARCWKGQARSYRLLPEDGVNAIKPRRTPKNYRDAKPVLFEVVGSHFLNIAVQAAGRERAGEFAQAISLWFQAKALAALDANATYCHYRIQYCTTAIERGWGCMGGAA